MQSTVADAHIVRREHGLVRRRATLQRRRKPIVVLRLTHVDERVGTRDTPDGGVEITRASGWIPRRFVERVAERNVNGLFRFRKNTIRRLSHDWISLARRRRDGRRRDGRRPLRGGRQFGRRRGDASPSTRVCAFSGDIARDRSRGRIGVSGIRRRAARRSGAEHENEHRRRQTKGSPNGDVS
jgi:hypothetical protein